MVQDSIGAGKFEDHVPPETTQLLVTRWAKELDPANDEFWDCIYPLPVDGEQPSLARPRLRHCRLDGAELAKTHEKALCERLVPLIRKGQAGVEELVVFCEKLEKHLAQASTSPQPDVLTNSFRDLSTLSTGLLALLGSSGAAASGPDAVKQLTQTKGTATALGVAHVAMTTSKHYQDWRGVVLWVAAAMFSLTHSYSRRTELRGFYSCLNCSYSCDLWLVT